VRSAYLGAATSAADLLGDLAVADAWDLPSALPDMTVGALASHLAGQLITVRDLLSAPPPAGAPIPLLEHYARARWVGADHEDEVNVSIRGGAEETAEGGPGALGSKVADVLDRLPDVLGQGREPDVVLIPWQGWALSVDDFLVTRMMEITVHSDDLAVSVDIATPDLTEQVLSPVLQLLASLAVRRHGQPAVVRALSRAERAPDTITAF
jgi:hypothetical protein